MIWTKAEGCRVWDTDGREYLDLSAGFGVAALGHRNPRVMEAIASAPVASLISATPALTISDDELDEAFSRLS